MFVKREDQRDNGNADDETPFDDDKDEELFLRNSLAKLESLEDVLGELEDYNELLLEEVDENDDLDEVLWDEESLAELLSSIPHDENEETETQAEHQGKVKDVRANAAAGLENALLQGVVPVSAGVGSECLPGDWGWDPLDFASKDYFRATQQFLLNLVPQRKGPSLAPSPQSMLSSDTKRPKALILRDYREAEIRHGRLAMLAAVFWPLQEMLDRLLLEEDQFGPLIYGPVTLPYFPLIMTAIMLLLGYLDIYSQAIKDMDRIGEAFLPGDCFWDPLRILDGAPDRMKRNMQERELFVSVYSNVYSNFFLFFMHANLTWLHRSGVSAEWPSCNGMCSSVYSTTYPSLPYACQSH